MTYLTRQELRLLYVLIGAVRDRDVPALQDKLRAMIAERAGERAWGAKVFEWRIPLSESVFRVRGKKAGQRVQRHLSPTLNAYGSMDTWARAALYKALDLRILAERVRWPDADLKQQVRKRAVRITRYSSSKPDEIAADVIGAKVPIDRLVQAGILAGDTSILLEREALWVKAAPKKGSLLLEVYELEVAPL